VVCMAFTILQPDKSIFKPQQEDFTEIARYLGYRRSDYEVSDAEIKKLIEECGNEMYRSILPKAVFDEFELKLQDTNISFSDVSFDSKDLSRNLKDCESVFLVAVTVGPQVDLLIRRYERTDSVKAAIMQSAGAMYAEKLIEYVNQTIKIAAKEKGLKTKPRYSAGYGDVSLELQKDFFRLLPCSKIGLTLMDTLIMAPEKSVTAFIGCGKF